MSIRLYKIVVRASTRKFYKIAEFSALPNTDVNMRALYHFIAEGTVCNNSWYRELGQPNELADITNFVEDINIQPSGDNC